MLLSVYAEGSVFDVCIPNWLNQAGAKDEFVRLEDVAGAQDGDLSSGRRRDFFAQTSPTHLLAPHSLVQALLRCEWPPAPRIRCVLRSGAGPSIAGSALQMPAILVQHKIKHSLAISRFCRSSRNRGRYLHCSQPESPHRNSTNARRGNTFRVDLDLSLSPMSRFQALCRYWHPACGSRNHWRT